MELKALTPTHKVFQALGRMGRIVLKTTVLDRPDVHVLATKSDDEQIAVLLVNFGTNNKNVNLILNDLPTSSTEPKKHYTLRNEEKS